MFKGNRVIRGLIVCASAGWSLVAVGADIVVGQVAPMTGVLADYGKDLTLGVSLYIRHTNDRGGVNGQKIRVAVRDDAYKVDETLKQTRDLLAKENPVALVGMVGTGNIAALLKENVLADANIPLVAPYTGGEALRTPFNPYIFHIRAGYADECEKMVAHLHAFAMDRIAVFYQDDPFGLAGLKGVEDALAKRKIKLLVKGTYEKNTDVIGKGVDDIVRADAQAVIMISVNNTTGRFMKDYREKGGRAQLYNISVVNPAALIKIAGAENAKGTGISQVMPFPFTRTTRVATEYLDLLKKYAPEEKPSYLSFESFVGAKLLVEGLRRAGPNPTREKVMRSLETVSNYDVGDFVLSYSPTNRVGSQYVDITVISKDGRLLH